VTSVPLRYRLLYDPLFLDLSRRFGEGFFGRVRGVGSSSVVSSSADFVQVCAFFFLFFGIPHSAQVFSDRSARLGRAVFLYEDFALSLDAFFVPAAVPAAAGVALTGSVSCEKALVEFRFGTERLAAYAPSESERYRLAFAEGDGEYYRTMDESYPEGPRAASFGRDGAAMEYAEKMIGRRFNSFLGLEG